MFTEQYTEQCTEQYTEQYVVWGNVSQQTLSYCHITGLTKVGRRIAFVLIGIAVVMTVFWGTPKTVAAQGDIIFTVPDLTVATTETTVSVPVSFVTPADVTLTGFRVELTYDATKLSVGSCTLVNTGFCNTNTAGTILFNGVGFAGITDGTVATILFTIANGATGSSPLTMSLSQILDSSLTDITSRATTEDGSITIQVDAVDVDDRMTRSVDNASLVFNNPTDPPSPFALLGSYSFDFVFTYSGNGFPLNSLYLKVNTATDAFLLNADGGPGGVDAVLTVDDADLPGGDSTFDPSEVLSVPLEIGFNATQSSLLFDLFAVEQTSVVSSDTVVNQEIYLGSILVNVNDLGNVTKIYLPLVASE